MFDPDPEATALSRLNHADARKLRQHAPQVDAEPMSDDWIPNDTGEGRVGDFLQSLLKEMDDRK